MSQDQHHRMGNGAPRGRTLTGLPRASAAHPAPTPTTIAQQVAPAATTISITGTLPAGRALTGHLSHLTTYVLDGALQLSGTISGRGLPVGGTTFTAPIRSLAASWGCTILTLNLGAVRVDAWGPVIDLAPVNLDVTAVPGAGGSLRNLLGAVTQLVDNGGPLQSVAALLNVLLTGLGL